MTNALGTLINPFQLPYVSFDDKVQLPEKSGLYFVIDGKQILYIGKTVHFKRRWANHHRYQQVKLMAKDPVIAWLDVEDTRLLDAESELIARFKPLLNWTRVNQRPSSAPNWSFGKKESQPKEFSYPKPLKIKFDWSSVRDEFEDALHRQLDEVETKAAGVRELFARLDQLDTSADSEVLEVLKGIEDGISELKKLGPYFGLTDQYKYPSKLTAMYDRALLRHLRENEYFG